MNFVNKRKFQFHSISVTNEEVLNMTPDSSPELTKKSWFGNLIATEKDETFTMLVKGKPLSTVKAHLIHSFLSVSFNKLCFQCCLEILSSSFHFTHISLFTDDRVVT